MSEITPGLCKINLFQVRELWKMVIDRGAPAFSTVSGTKLCLWYIGKLYKDKVSIFSHYKKHFVYMKVLTFDMIFLTKMKMF